MLIHGNTGAIDLVSKDLFSFLKNSNSSSVYLSPSLKNKLISRGYLTNKTKEEIEDTTKQIEIMYKKDLFKSCDITWVVSYKCNFSCPYCFEKNRIHFKTFSKSMVDIAYRAMLIKMNVRQKKFAQLFCLAENLYLLKIEKL